MQNPRSDVTMLNGAEEAVAEKEEPNPLSFQWKRQYMRGISATPSQAGVYYEALKGSSASLARGYVGRQYVFFNTFKKYLLNFFDVVKC